MMGVVAERQLKGGFRSACRAASAPWWPATRSPRSGHRVVQLGGFEPPTSGSTIRRSNQLSYNCTSSKEGRKL